MKKKKEIDDKSVAIAYYMNGVLFQMSAKTLCKEIEVNEKNIPKKYTGVPFYYLCSHAAELFLKAALLKRGFKQADLKKYDYRHNLGALLKELKNKGLVITKNTELAIEALDKQHKKHILRYTVLLDDGEGALFPPLCCCLEMLDELLSLTRISTQGI